MTVVATKCFQFFKQLTMTEMTGCCRDLAARPRNDVAPDTGATPPLRRKRVPKVEIHLVNCEIRRNMIADNEVLTEECFQIIKRFAFYLIVHSAVVGGAREMETFGVAQFFLSIVRQALEVL